MARQKNSKQRKNTQERANSVESAAGVAPLEVSSIRSADPALAPAAEPATVPQTVDKELVAQVGFAAGKVWRALQNNPLRLSELGARVDEPEPVILMAVGWLAREDKLVIIGRAQELEFSLKEHWTRRA